LKHLAALSCSLQKLYVDRGANYERMRPRHFAFADEHPDFMGGVSFDMPASPNDHQLAELHELQMAASTP